VEPLGTGHVRAIMDAVANDDENRQLAVYMQAAGLRGWCAITMTIDIDSTGCRAQSSNPACSLPVPHVIERWSPAFCCIIALTPASAHTCHGQYPIQRCFILRVNHDNTFFLRPCLNVRRLRELGLIAGAKHPCTVHPPGLR
jgi:hypothetical protein